MNQKEKALSALTAVFPNTRSIADFLKDSEGRKRLQSFIDFAARNSLIDAPTHKAFYAFIDANSRPPINNGLDDLTLEEFINRKKDYLKIRISDSVLVDKINAILSDNAINLPQLSRAMFTRLKKQVADTPRRRDALRGFAFWIGYERSDMDQEWHYETLKGLCRDHEYIPSYDSHGIRIAFSINSRGNLIGQDIITWIKKAVRSAFCEKENPYGVGNPSKVKSYDLTTFHVDLFNTDPSAIPSAYANALKQAIAIAHRIAILWIMSGFADDNRFFSIGIAAGNFDEFNNQLQGILNAKLPEDPVIRLTDYARQCVGINQIKIIMNHLPVQMELSSGEAIKVWWVTELSGMMYWELVPDIIDESFLKEDLLNPIELRRQMFIPIEAKAAQHSNAINHFLKFPHHSMLGFEIVRTLVCRKKFSEGLEILNALLRVTPNHLNSRIVRMALYKYLGMEAVDYYLSDMMFRMAEKEAAYIIENLGHAREDFYFEYGLLKLARLSTAVQALRQHDSAVLEMMNLRIAAPDLVELLNQAEEIVMQGIIVSSPSMERIIYLFLTIQVLKCVLYNSIGDEERISMHLTCPNDKIKHYMAGVFISQYQQMLTSGASDISRVMEFVDEAVRYGIQMISMEAFRPAHLYTIAVFYWDILPMRNVAIVKETLKIMKNIKKSAGEYARKEEYIYSTVNPAGQFVPADQFIKQIDSMIKEIEKRYNKASELEKMDPAAVIGRFDDDLVLMTYHI